MATELTLRRGNGAPFGSFEETATLIRQLFPTVEFSWTTSRPDKLRLAKERGIQFPPELAKSLETLPSLYEGIAQGEGYHVTFGLGHDEPVNCLYVTPRGDATEMITGLTALAEVAGSQFQVS